MSGRHSLLVVLVALGALALAAPPASATKSLPYYVRVTLAERYFSTQADGSSWESQASIDAEYRTTYEQAVTGAPLSPRVLASHFEAALRGRGAGGATNCTFVGKPGPGGAGETFTVPNTAPAAGEAPWPDFPGRWDQTRTSASTSDCPPTFGLNPVQGFGQYGETIWTPRTGSSSATDHFNSAIAGFRVITARDSYAADVQGVEMSSRTTYGNGEIYIVDAWGSIVQSRAPIRGVAQNDLSLMRDSQDAALPTLNALTAAGRREVGLPKGCVRGERRHRHQRCR